MRHVIDQAAAWQRSGTRFAMATVVRTWGSSPHGPGASMLVSEDGRMVGSVSGGCVEAAVCAIAEEVLAGAAPTVERWGVGDEDAFAVGLTCGGTIEVLVREVGPEVPLGQACRRHRGKRAGRSGHPLDSAAWAWSSAAGRRRVHWATHARTGPRPWLPRECSAAAPAGS